MKRFDCLKLLAGLLEPTTLVVANVGPISREWNALRPGEANLLQVNLGLCAAVGLGLASSLPNRQVVILDGDGNLLLNLASLADMANRDLGNMAPLTVLPETFFVLGDNRRASNDSRDWGAVPDENIVGRAWMSFWPLDRWHALAAIPWP